MYFLLCIFYYILIKKLKNYIKINRYYYYSNNLSKMKVFIFDTETTGLPEDFNTPVTELSKWPHIVQLSFILFDTDKKEILEYYDHVIKVDPSVIISPESIAIHHITHERCLNEGIPINQALHDMEECIKEADLIVGHNILFDKRMIMVEYNRIQRTHCLNRNGKEIPEYCTMKRTVSLCEIKIANKTTGKMYNKYPTLSELHEYLFKTKPKGTHNSIVDVMVCMRCYIQIEHRYDIAYDNDIKLVFRSLYSTYCL